MNYSEYLDALPPKAPRGHDPEDPSYVSDVEYRILASMHRCAGFVTFETFMSLEAVSEDTGYDIQNLRRAHLPRLERKGYLTRKSRPGLTDLWTLALPAEALAWYAEKTTRRESRKARRNRNAPDSSTSHRA